ncbi:hypothetical protein G6L30_17070 [Agrobacterium rhizogenes]|nr:hypothetical protein [Rhizobium rhizogenes]
MKLGNFEAIPEEGSGNFATSIYEDEYDGLLIARCNQNGRYPEHARAILEGLNGKKHGLDQITALTAERDSLKALCDEMAKALEPFAKAGQVIDGPFGPALFVEDDTAFKSGCAWSENGVRRTITWGDFRRASAAYSKEKEVGNG